MARRQVSALDRVGIVMALVPYVQEHGPTSIEAAARMFDVTPAVMRELVENLNVIGLPGGMDHELFGIDWDAFDERDEIDLVNVVAFERAPRLTAREAAALLAGLHYLETSLPSASRTDVIGGLIAKLARGAADAPGQLALAADPVDEVRATVADALDRGLAVAFTYRSIDGEVTTRTVDPIRLLVSESQWYLRAWCHLRRDIRTFHLERVSDLVVTDTPAGEHEDHETTLLPGRGGDVGVRIAFPTSTAPLLGHYLENADVSAAGDSSTAVVYVADPRALTRLAARRGGEVELVDPPVAREAVSEWVQSALAQYDS